MASTTADIVGVSAPTRDEVSAVTFFILSLIGGAIGVALGWLLAICFARSCTRCLLGTTFAGSLTLVAIHLLFTAPV